MAVKLVLIRFQRDDKQTLGRLFVINDETGVTFFQCYTLELTWKNNQRNVSCIPYSNQEYFMSDRDYDRYFTPEYYKVKKRYSKKHTQHLHIVDVPDRSYILIHAGNYYTDIKGCILVGDTLIDKNKNGHKDIEYPSREVLNRLLNIIPEKETKLYIFEVI